MLCQTAEISKAINPGAVSIGPAGLQCVTAHQIESDKLEALVRVAHVRTRNVTEHIRLAATSRARAGTPQWFEVQKCFCTVVPGDGDLVSDLLDVARLKSHFRFFFQGAAAFQPPRRSKDRSSLLFAHQKSPCHAHQRRAFLDSNCKI